MRTQVPNPEWYLDPSNTAYSVPDDWDMIEVTGGILTDIIQYNTLACP